METQEKGRLEDIEQWNAGFSTLEATRTAKCRDWRSIFPVAVEAIEMRRKIATVKIKSCKNCSADSYYTMFY